MHYTRKAVIYHEVMLINGSKITDQHNQYPFNKQRNFKLINLWSRHWWSASRPVYIQKRNLSGLDSNCLVAKLDGIWASIHQADGRLTVRSRKVAKPRGLALDFSIALKFDRHLGSSAAEMPVKFQISERYDHYNIQSRGFETSRDWAVRRLTA